jgi:general secretion pathway protein G
MKNRSITRRAAFTLVEVLLVIALIGFIATLAIRNIAKSSAKGKTGIAKAMISNLKNSCQEFEIDTGKFPSGLNDLITNPGATGWDGPYLDKLPKDPWNNDYTYALSGESFEIRSGGAPGANKPISSKD